MTSAKKPAKKKAKAPAAHRKGGRSEASVRAKQSLWVEAMLVNGGNQTAAAVAAGAKPGKGAEQYGYRVAKNPEVMARLEQRRQEMIEESKRRTQLHSDDVLLSAKRAIVFDPRKLYHADGRIKAVHELDDDTALAIQSIEIEETPEAAAGGQSGVRRKYRFKASDRNAARDQAMRHLGMYREDNAQRPAGVAQTLMDVDAVTKIIRDLNKGA